MTYFAGVVLHNQVAVVADRREVRLYPILGRVYERPNDLRAPKWEGVRFSDTFPTGPIFFLWSGHGTPAKLFFDEALKDLVARPFVIDDLRTERRHFMKIANGIWSEWGPRLVDSNARRKDPAPTVNLTLLFGGLDSRGSPFLMVLESYNRFEGAILTNPGAFYILQHEPEVEEQVKEIFRTFLGRIKGTQGSGIMRRVVSLSEESERELAREMLPPIIPLVSRHDRYVSPCGDLLIIHRGGREVLNFDV